MSDCPGCGTALEPAGSPYYDYMRRCPADGCAVKILDGREL